MFFELPKLSDKEAYKLCNCLQDLVMTVESHYCMQIRRYLKTLEESLTLQIETEVDPDADLSF